MRLIPMDREMKQRQTGQGEQESEGQGDEVGFHGDSPFGVLVCWLTITPNFQRSQVCFASDLCLFSGGLTKAVLTDYYRTMNFHMNTTTTFSHALGELRVSGHG